MIRDEDLDEVMGQARVGVNRLVPEDTDVVEGQIYIVHVPKPGDQADDTEGQGRTGVSRSGQTDEDVEGQLYRIKLQPATPEDVEGHGGRHKGLRETDEGLDPRDRRRH